MAVKYSEVVSAIVTGLLDEQLVEMSTLIRERRDKIALRLARTIKSGDRVELFNIRPEHLIGQRATVLKLNRTTVTIRMDADKDKPFAPTHRVPLACCKIVENQPQGV